MPPAKSARTKRKTAAPPIHRADSISSAVSAWEVTLANAGHSANTVKAFTADVRLLARYLGAGRSIGEIATRDLTDFLHWMEHGRSVPCSPKTYSRRVTSIKAFFRFLQASGVCEADPAAVVIQRSVQSPLPEILTERETEAALQAAFQMYASSRNGKRKAAVTPANGGDSRPFILISLLLQTGIKKGECAAIRLSHIETGSSAEPMLFVRYSNPQQRFKERKLPLNREWADVYRKYLADYSPSDRVFPWSPRRLEYILEDIGEKAGLRKHLSFDMCRWTCAVKDRRKGMEADEVRQKLGLSKIQWREVGAKINRLLETADAR